MTGYSEVMEHGTGNWRLGTTRNVIFDKGISRQQLWVERRFWRRDRRVASCNFSGMSNMHSVLRADELDLQLHGLRNRIGGRECDSERREHIICQCGLRLRHLGRVPWNNG